MSIRFTRLALTAAVTLPLLIATSVTASAEEAVTGPVVPSGTPAPDPGPVTGPSADTGAITQAASRYSANDVESATALARAASAAVAIDLVGTGQEASVDASGLLPTTVVVEDASAMMSNPQGLEIGIAASGDAGSSSLIGGAAVTQDVAAGVDIVTRAIPDGMQLVAALEDENADERIDFAMEVPENAVLEPQVDGSMDIVLPVETVVEDDQDAAPFEAEVEAIIGEETTLESFESISDEQWAALEALEPVATTTEMLDTPVATIGAAWAVDAAGKPVATRYELDGTTLTQVIAPDASTTFPVTADPSVWWWTVSIATCAVEIAVIFVPGSKALSLLSKAKKIVANSKKLSAAVAKLGSLKTAMSRIVQYIKNKNSLSKATRTKVKGVLVLGFDSVLDALGFGTCGSVIRQLV